VEGATQRPLPSQTVPVAQSVVVAHASMQLPARHTNGAHAVGLPSESTTDAPSSEQRRSVFTQAESVHA